MFDSLVFCVSKAFNKKRFFPGGLLYCKHCLSHSVNAFKHTQLYNKILISHKLFNMSPQPDQEKWNWVMVEAELYYLILVMSHLLTVNRWRSLRLCSHMGNVSACGNSKLWPSSVEYWNSYTSLTKQFSIYFVIKHKHLTPFVEKPIK